MIGVIADMNNRKLLTIGLACLLAFSMTACNKSKNQQHVPQASSLPGANPSTAGAGAEISPVESLPPDTLKDHETSEGIEIDNRTGRHEFADSHLTIDLSLDREDYTVNDILDLKVKITNHSDQAVAFQKGSGSNRVPDALVVTLGRLTSLHHPTIATMDMQYEVLEAGKSLEYEVPFAPYTPLADDVMGPGLDQTLDWFQGHEEYEPAHAGKVDGTLHFYYQVVEGDTFEGPFTELVEGGTPSVIKGEFTAHIVEAR